MLDRLYVFDGYAGWDPEVSQLCLLIDPALIVQLYVQTDQQHM